MQQQGLLKYGWADLRLEAEDRNARDKPSRWRRQWLVLREDGLLLCYGKAKDTQPAQVMGTTPT